MRLPSEHITTYSLTVSRVAKIGLSHVKKTMLLYLKRISFCQHTPWSKKLSPFSFHCSLNSPDLNPVDYRIWDVMQDSMYQTPVWDEADLRQRLIDTWNDLSQSIVDDAVDEWCK